MKLTGNPEHEGLMWQNIALCLESDRTVLHRERARSTIVIVLTLLMALIVLGVMSIGDGRSAAFVSSRLPHLSSAAPNLSAVEQARPGSSCTAKLPLVRTYLITILHTSSIYGPNAQSSRLPIVDRE